MSSLVAIALGSNLGDRRAYLEAAAARLAACLSGLRLSRLIETEPFEVPSPQPPYLNAVALGSTALDPAALLSLLLEIERGAGRRRTAPRAPRTLDLDLILFADRIIDEAGLTVPHPRFRDRPFVLEPLAELAPEWVDPVTGKSIAELRDELRIRTQQQASS